MSEIEPEAAPAEAAPAELAEPEWSGPSRDEWEQAQTLLGEYEQLRQQSYQQQQQPAEQGPQAPDPWAEDYPQQLEAYVDAKLQFVQQLQQEMIQQEGHQAAMATFDKLASSGGQFDKEMAWTVARELVAQSGRVPTSERESQEILSRAAAQVREYERRVGEDYYQQKMEQMQTVAGGPRRLPPGTPGTAQTVPAGGYGNVPYAVADRFFGGT